MFRYRLVVVTAGQGPGCGAAPGSGGGWSTRPGTDPGSDTGAAAGRGCGIPEGSIGVFPNQTAAWAAAADGAGVAPAVEHLVAQQLRRGELSLVEVPGLPRSRRLARDTAGAAAAAAPPPARCAAS